MKTIATKSDKAQVEEFIRSKGVVKVPTVKPGEVSPTAFAGELPKKRNGWKPSKPNASGEYAMSPAKKGRNQSEIVLRSLDAKAKAVFKPGPVPRLEWLSLSDLSVDGRYQRDASNENSRGLINRIAMGFRWALFQPLTVAEASPETGDTVAELRRRYTVIDGQHRRAGAIRCGIERVPCYIIDASTVEEQAGHFVGLNRERKVLLPTQLHRAAAVAGDTDALALDAVCARAEVKIAPASKPGGLPPGQTLAVAQLRLMIKKYGPDITVAALTLLRESAGIKFDQIRSGMISAVCLMLFDTSWTKSIDTKVLGRVIAYLPAAQWEFKARERRSAGDKRNQTSVLAALLAGAYETMPRAKS